MRLDAEVTKLVNRPRRDARGGVVRSARRGPGLGTRWLLLAAVVGAFGVPLLVAGPAHALTTCLTPGGEFGPCATQAPPSSAPAHADDVEHRAPVVGRQRPPNSVSVFTIFTIAAIVVGLAMALAASDG